MNRESSQMILSTSPFMKRPVDSPAIMRHVIYALTPVMTAAVFFFGIRAILLLLTCALGAALTEWVFTGRGSLKNS
ncbi:MAG: RnfABCDGE type electron transport complex subunit D, partial [Candidatus Latescibacterota bacterium]